MKHLSLVFIVLFIIFSLNLNSSVTHIWPSSGTNDTTRTCRVFGGGFNGGVSGVSLQKSTYPNVYATNITVVNDNYLTCEFNLTGVSTTTYNLIVKPDTLDMCFTVNYLNKFQLLFWEKTDLFLGLGWINEVSVGDGNNDGQLEVYGACHDDHMYQFKWNGSSWDKSDIGSGGHLMNDVAVGDGNNDGLFEVYGSNFDSHIYQFSWNGYSWDKTDLGSFGGRMNGVAVGDGNNDGQLEVYGTNANNNIYQFSWNGDNWGMTVVGSGGSDMFEVAVGDGNNDGLFEIYGCYYYALNQFSWNGNSWNQTCLDSIRNWLKHVEVGDGNNDGFLEPYGADWDGRIYIYNKKPKYLLDTMYNYNGIALGDSSIWCFYINNVANQDLIIDSVNIPMTEYSIINHFLPDTITPDDSIDIDIMFKPESIGYYPCLLQIFLNDPLFPVLNVFLEGTGDSTYPTKVNLIFPDSSGFSNSSVEFCWHPSFDSFPGIEYYKLQYALDSNFTISFHEFDRSDTFLTINYLPDNVYYWRVKAVDSFGLEGPWSNIWNFTVDHLGIEEEVNIINGFNFSFASFSRERTVFRFSIPELSNISIKIYDIAGREVSELISGQREAGYYEIPFKPESSGMYFYRLESKFLNETGKFTVLR